MHYNMYMCTRPKDTCTTYTHMCTRPKDTCTTHTHICTNLRTHAQHIHTSALT